MKTRQRKSEIMLEPVSTAEVINNLMKCEILYAIWSFCVQQSKNSCPQSDAKQNDERSGAVDFTNKGPARIRHNLKIQLLFFKIISLICWLGPGSSTGQRVSGLLKPLGNQHLGIRNIHRDVQISCSQARRVGGISLFFLLMKVLNFS